MGEPHKLMPALVQLTWFWDVVNSDVGHHGSKDASLIAVHPHGVIAIRTNLWHDFWFYEQFGRGYKLISNRKVQSKVMRRKMGPLLLF